MPLILLLISLTLPIIAHAQDNLATQRLHFRNALTALENKDMKTYQQYYAQLNGYIIQPYLDYYRLRSQLNNLKIDEFNQFSQQTTGFPIQEKLRLDWLRSLGQQQKWQLFQTLFTPNLNPLPSDIRCYAMQAEIQLKQKSNDWENGKPQDFWNSNQLSHAACQPVLTHYLNRKILNSTDFWQLFSENMEKNKPESAQIWLKYLSAEDKKRATYWQQSLKNPLDSLANFNLSDSVENRTVLQHLLKTVARKEVAQTMLWYKKLEANYTFTPEQHAEIQREIAFNAFRQRHPDAPTWFNALPENQQDEKLRFAYLQYLLIAGQWADLASLLTTYPEDERWQYWQARALAESGNANAAQTLWATLAKKRSYYGFLAADRLNSAYNLENKAINVTEEEKNALLNNPLIQAARELFYVDLGQQGAELIKTALEGKNSKTLQVFASLAHEWSWYQQAIIYAAKGDAYDDLTLRFPTPYYDLILRYAETNNIDYGWVYAVIRQESAFQLNARSSANALGLMQLLPDTARMLAKKAAIKLPEDETALFEPELNIQLGTAFLRQLLTQFDGNYILATAAYNAGPGRSKKWREELGCVAPDVWIELIPFSETREYVQRVLNYIPVFEARLTGQTEVARMPLQTVQEACD